MANSPCALAIGLDEGDAVGLVAAGHGEIVRCVSAVDREEAAGGAVFRGPYWRWWRWSASVRFVAGRRPKNSTNLPTTPFLRSIWVTVSTRSVAVDAFRHRTRQLEADDFGDQHRDRLAQHGRLGLDAADAPAQHGQTVDHGGVAVGADDGVGIGDRLLAFVQGPDGLGQVLQVDLVADAGAGRHDAEVVEGRRAPAQEVVALDVALVFALDVLAEGFRRAEVVDHDEWSMTRSDRHQRVDLGGVGAQGAHGVAHGGQVDHGGNAGEVLHQDAGRTEGDLVLDRALVLDPGGDGLQVIFCDGDPVLVAQQVLQQHLHGARQAGNPGQTGFLGGGKAVIGVFLTPGRKGPGGS